MGIILLAIAGLYLLVSLGVVIGAMAYARKAGKSPKRWGWSAALVMYLIPFWDWIPTVAVHQYYCATEAGFWVYKTPEQWMKENPGVMEGLVEDRVTQSSRIGNDANHIDTRSLNQYFYWTTEKHQAVVALSIYRWQDELAEKRNRQAVARRIGFSVGEGRDSAKFWMNIAECPNGEETLIALRQFVRSIVIVNQGETK
ncbi:MAG: hypothetical protein FD157_4150 [Rhodocyclaceae bacterium]|nr:MAG: hypothetical protein FD157_4150 [Rhodocyclaceae bacterium]TNC96537.1 MAG: hypothetical protein FD118_4152 [Rhodocyclaceae bacterium]